MTDCKHFRISLNLSNFFRDHRSMCKIFINKEIKYISNLEERISTIFNIRNFYLVSQNHYLPPTEDVRILQHDDILFAIPNHNSISCTNISQINKGIEKQNIETNTDTLSIAIKRKNSNSDLDERNSKYYETRKKKKKKSKHTEQEVSHLNVEDGMVMKRINYDSDLEERNFKCSEIEHCSVENNIKSPSKKKKKKNKHMEQDEEEFEKNILDASVEEKVLYFDKQVNVNKSANKIQTEVHTNNSLSSKISDKNVSDKNPRTALMDDEKQQNFSNFRKKKLLVQKRNTDIISFDLPRNFNIVKSVLVSNVPCNTTQLSEDKSYLLNKNCSKEKYMLKEEGSFECSKKDTNYSIDKICSHNVYEYNQSNESMPLKEDDTNEFDTAKCLNTDIVTQKTDIEICNNLQQNNDTNNMEPVLNVNNTSTPIQSINVNDESIDDGKIPDPIEFSHNGETLQNRDLTKLTTPLNNSVVSINSSETESYYKKANALSVGETSACEGTTKSSTVTDKNNVNTEFITKRKRKRTHRKRKTKIITNENPLPIFTPKNDKISFSSAAHTNHIKFNDEGEPVGDSDQAGMEGNSNSGIQSMDISTNGISEVKERLPLKEEIQVTESSEQTNLCNDSTSNINTNNATNTTNEPIQNMKKWSNNCNALIHEETILRSPLMISTKPRCGDIIAFQILRLSDDYTPKISNHLTGEVLEVSDDTTDVKIRIIDGIDECRGPEGKFSIEEESESYTNIKSFCWKTLIAPRLIFP